MKFDLSALYHDICYIEALMKNQITLIFQHNIHLMSIPSSSSAKNGMVSGRRASYSWPSRLAISSIANKDAILTYKQQKLFRLILSGRLLLFNYHSSIIILVIYTSLQQSLTWACSKSRCKLSTSAHTMLYFDTKPKPVLLNTLAHICYLHRSLSK